MPNVFNVFTKGEKVFHAEYGEGTVVEAKYIPSVGGVSIVQFDVKNDNLYDWMGYPNCCECKSHELQSQLYL